MGAIEIVEKAQMTERPQMKAGDTVKVHVKVREGDKERIQVLEGIVIGMQDQVNLPVKFIGLGEKADDVEPFSPTDFVNALFE